MVNPSQITMVHCPSIQSTCLFHLHLGGSAVAQRFESSTVRAFDSGPAMGMLAGFYSEMLVRRAQAHSDFPAYFTHFGQVSAL